MSNRIKAEIDQIIWVDPGALPDLPLAPLTRDYVLPLARVGASFAGRSLVS